MPAQERKSLDLTLDLTLLSSFAHAAVIIIDAIDVVVVVVKRHNPVITSCPSEKRLQHVCTGHISGPPTP